MKVVRGFPPNYAAIRKAFNPSPRTVYTYGETLYVGTGDTRSVPQHLSVHEGVHARRQITYKGGPAAWWERYIDDPAFRLDEEVRAYRAQIAFVSSFTAAAAMRRFVDRLAHDLASPIYKLGLSEREASRLIDVRPATGVV